MQEGPGDEALNGLDVEQRAAVTTPSTLVAVIAAAGSGKTRVLTSRIAHRVGNGTADARHTLALTFTREAAGELRRRLRRAGLRDAVEAGTFHSVALGLLRRRWADQSVRELTVVGDRRRLLAELRSDVPLDVLATEADWVAARGITADHYVRAARAAQRRGGVAPERIAAALDAYETLKHRRGVLDLDDVLARCARELAGDGAFADAVRWRFRHVLVDEAQDLNPVQFELLQLLTEGRRDLYLVGDPAQAIYGFNGSDPTLLGDIGDHLPGIEIVHLPTNHRSTTPIVAAGEHVLRQAGQEAGTVARRGDGDDITVIGTADAEDEARVVAELIHGLDPSLVRQTQVAVLARTNHQLGPLGDALRHARLPVRRRQMAASGPLAMAVRAATSLPSASRLRAWAHDVLDEPQETDARVDAAIEAERRMAAATLEFLREQPLGDGAALRSWVATTNPFAEEADAHGVELLTFHGAKGREWHTVVVTGVETGLVPHRSATTNGTRAEEARLLHVALTRATDELFVTWAARRGGYARKPSPLIAGLATERSAPEVPAFLHRDTAPPDPRAQRLQQWRDVAARGAAVLPEDLCTDAQLDAILVADPQTPADLAAATAFGPITASRLFASVRAALDGETPSVPA